MYKVFFYIFLAIAVIWGVKSGLAYADLLPAEENLGAAIISGEAYDVVGTRYASSTPTVATSTPQGVGFYGNYDATTTYPVLIDSEASEAVFTVMPTVASSSAGAYFSILASNENNCDTASTTTTMPNTVITKDIQWFDAGRWLNGLTNTVAAFSTALSTGTSTLAMENIIPGVNKQITLTEVNTKCLALQISGSSVEMWVQLKTKK